MTDDIDPKTVELFNVCNASLTAAINCAEHGQKPCETCELMVECKRAKEELDELWKTKGD
jgi:hypothetical protein